MRRYLTIEEVRNVETMLAAGYTVEAVAKATKHVSDTVKKIRDGKNLHQLTPEQRKALPYTPPAVDPTPEEIEAHCAEIRESKVKRHEPWEFPVVSLSHLHLT